MHSIELALLVGAIAVSAGAAVGGLRDMLRGRTVYRRNETK